MKPSDFGITITGDEYRQYQEETILEAAFCPEKIVLIEAPTGAGKSLIARTLSAITKADKTVIAAHQIALQEQYLSSFPEMKGVKGRANFPCLVQDTYADNGPCNFVGPKDCTIHQEARCPYYNQLAEAMEAPITVHNYAYWMIAANAAKRFSNLDLLICDEAHLVEDQVLSYVSIQLSERSCRNAGVTLPDLGKDADAWRRWAESTKESLRTARDAMGGGSVYDMNEAQVKFLKAVSTLSQNCAILTELNDDWIIQRSQLTGLSYTFQPVWVSNYGTDLLLDHIKPSGKLIAMSATILDAGHFCEGLGLHEDVKFIRMPSTFPKENRPVILIPTTKVRMNMPDEEVTQLVNTVDVLLARHPTWKGLIHTANYNLAYALNERSRFRNRMMTHGSKDRLQVLERFKGSTAPKVLVSPSMTTGIDLAYDFARFQIIAKLPFPNKGDERIARRMKEGPDGFPNPRGQAWYSWRSACEFVQSCGRVVRAPDDMGVTYVLDANLKWFIPNVKHILPEWFKEAMRYEVLDEVVVNAIT